MRMRMKPVSTIKIVQASADASWHWSGSDTTQQYELLLYRKDA
jgi:hypothetical protein